MDGVALKNGKKRQGKLFGDPDHKGGRPKGCLGKVKREQKELLGALREIVQDNVAGLELAFPDLVEHRPADAWRIAITLCPKEMTMEHKGLELPPIVVALQALRDQVKKVGN